MSVDQRGEIKISLCIQKLWEECILYNSVNILKDFKMKFNTCLCQKLKPKDTGELSSFGFPLWVDSEIKTCGQVVYLGGVHTEKKGRIEKSENVKKSHYKGTLLSWSPHGKL